MHRNHGCNKSCLIKRLVILAAGILFLCGFSFSDPHKLSHEIRAEIKAELQKIVEKTPSAKLRRQWRSQRDKASSAIEKAQLVEAAKYCPEKWDEAVVLFKKARYYSSRRSYRKAIFLAKKAEETADEAARTSRAILQAKRTNLIKAYKKLRARTDGITGTIPPDADKLLAEASRISLAVEDIRIAIDLRQFEDAGREIPLVRQDLGRLEKRIKLYKKLHPANDKEI